MLFGQEMRLYMSVSSVCIKEAGALLEDGGRKTKTGTSPWLLESPSWASVSSSDRLPCSDSIRVQRSVDLNLWAKEQVD